MEVIYFYDSVLGKYALGGSEDALTRMWIGSCISSVPSGIEVREISLFREAHAQLESYFAGKLQGFTIPLLPCGTDFQLRVWEELKKIPYGETITYGQLAEHIGNRNASRAVGMANSRNPLPVFIPCHRVTGANGKLVGYTGGLDIKIKLLQIEQRDRYFAL